LIAVRDWTEGSNDLLLWLVRFLLGRGMRMQKMNHNPEKAFQTSSIVHKGGMKRSLVRMLSIPSTNLQGTYCSNHSVKNKTTP